MAFWVMYFFGLTCIKKTMAFIGVGIMFLGMFSIYLSMESRDSEALILTNYFDTLYLSLTFMTSGLFVLSVLALVGAWKNPFTCRVAFTALSITMMVLYAYYGIKVILITSEITHALGTTECRMLREFQEQAEYDNSIDDSKSAVYTIENDWIYLLNSLYLMGRSSYCLKSPYGCPWYDSTPVIDDFYYDDTDEDAIKTVQGCRDKILGSYEDYPIVLGLDEFETYFKFIGEIEKEHLCSGFWAKEDVYYFYDITVAGPDKSCDDALMNDVIPNNINFFAGNLIIISAALFLSMFVHMGLYKKEKYNKLANDPSEDVQRNEVNNASRMDNESRASNF